ncbi:MAG: permease, partial [Planctomycetota bacterium]
MFEHYLAGGGLRLAEVVIYSSIWIVTGCLIAAIFRRMLGEQKVRQLFANDTRWGLATGWLIGMLLPVCSLGVIPVVRELHRSGVNRGTIVAFGLTAPLFNPMSVLYGLTLSDPIAILSFSLCALLIVSVLGFIWDRWGVEKSKFSGESRKPAVGIKRMIAVFDSASREMVGPTLIYIVIGILASVSLAVMIPKGFLQDQVERDNIWAPINVALMATPIYSTPLLAMSQIGGMFQHGNSIGGAFSLLILGAGVNLGLLAWFARTYGVKKFVMFYLLLVMTTVSLAYAVDKPLIPKGVDPAGHSHAFDVYTHPFGENQPNEIFYAKLKAAEFWEKNEFGATTMMAGMMVCGIVFVVIRKFFDLDEWMTADKELEKMDRIVPGWVLGLTTVVGLIATSVTGCYLYYPAPKDLLADMAIVNTECVLSARNGDWEAAEK